MKKLLGLILGILCFNVVLLAQKTKNKTFQYSGNNWEKYEGHKLSIVVLDTSIEGVKVYAEQIIKNGKFAVSGEIAIPENAFFGMYNPKGDYVYKQEFIVEPGKLRIDLDTNTNSIKVDGGKYNKLFSAIKEDPIFKERFKAYEEYRKNITPIDYREQSVKDKYAVLSKAAYGYSQEQYDLIRFHSKDPVARLLAIKNSNRSISYKEDLLDLEKALGGAPEIVYLKYNLAASEKRKNNRVRITVGSIIKDFNAQDLEGNTIQLADVLKKNKYTLVEFWASWCGPCREEIPHMKRAYEEFKDKGFEILSFTLDHEKNRWEKASTEEKIPWINIGDLQAFKSPVVNLFGINGVPANYLVDQTGKIVAVNLRQEKLDEKLAELL